MFFLLQKSQRFHVIDNGSALSRSQMKKKFLEIATTKFIFFLLSPLTPPKKGKALSNSFNLKFKLSYSSQRLILWPRATLEGGTSWTIEQTHREGHGWYHIHPKNKHTSWEGCGGLHIEQTNGSRADTIFIPSTTNKHLKKGGDAHKNIL